MSPAATGTDGPVFYHGGPPGLPVGGYVLPRVETGARGFSDQLPTWIKEFADPAAPALNDATFAFVTTTLKYAAWLALHKSRNAMVYVVEPEEFEPDPDYPTRGDMFRCARAKIFGIARVPFRIRQEYRDRIFRRGGDDEAYSAQHDLGHVDRPDIDAEIEHHVADLQACGCAPGAIAIALTAAASELMLRCSKREAQEKAKAAWALVLAKQRDGLTCILPPHRKNPARSCAGPLLGAH